MKIFNYLIGIVILSSACYMVSCDIAETNVNNSNNKSNITKDKIYSCSAPPVRCSLPSYCNNGNGDHFCLYLRYGTTKEEFNYFNVAYALVTHSGRDCNNNVFGCTYLTIGGSASSMGCVLPWCSNNCVYTRSVCLVTVDGKYYTGSVQFSYANYSGCTIDVYETEYTCDFGGIESQNN